MFKNYLLVAIRVLNRDKVSSFVNIGGLAVGLATVIMISLFVRDELGYDSFWDDAENIYRIDATVTVEDRLPETIARLPSTVRDSLLKDYSEIETAVRLIYREPVVKLGDQVYFERVTAVDPEFFDIFNLTVEEGNGPEALQSMSSVILTRRMATKYFGQEPALGKTIDITMRLDNVVQSYRVGAVISDPPLNSHFDTDIIMAINRIDYLHPDGQNGLDDWATYRGFYAYTYLKFKAGAGIKAIESGLDGFIKRSAPSSFSLQLAYEPEQYFDFNFINISDIYLKGPEGRRIKPGGDLMTIYSYVAVAMLILLISSINFINLTTAKSVVRSKEISLRKIMGAHRTDIIKQFLGETSLIMIMALIAALALVYLAIPTFNSEVLTMIKMNFLGDPAFQLGLAGLIIVLVLGAGFYPSFVASNFRPVDALRSRHVSGVYSGKLRGIFVVMQFAISIALIVSTIVIYQQTRFARSMDLGYLTDNIMVLRGINESPSSSAFNVLRDRMTSHPDISSVSFSLAAPFDLRSGLNDFYRLDIGSMDPVMISTRYIDEEYFPTYEVPMLGGRNFDKAHRLDVTTTRNDNGTLIEIESAAVLNEAAAAQLGFSRPQDALGVVLGWGNGTNPRTVRVIGIVPNIRLKPATFADEPNVFIWVPFLFSTMSVRYNSSDLPALSTWVERTWSQVVPDRPLQRGFLSTQIVAAYAGAEIRFKMLAVFSLLAILISSLGLYAMASFDVQRRTLEVGVRKVLGASTGNITRLLIWQFSRPVLIANLIAWPASWYLMSDWLEAFAYRIDLSPTYFLIAGSCALLVSWVTVGIKAWLVARTNPVHALRYE